MLQDLKDKVLAIALRALVNERYSEYGSAEECDIDTELNRLTLRVVLKGEAEPITAIIERYEIEKADGDVYLVITEVSASREWLSVLLKRLAHGKRQRLPAHIAMLL